MPRTSVPVRRGVRSAVKVELKIWRYDAATGERALRPYEVDVSEEATLLDTLDVVKDRVDGTLAYRKSCRMMICGSCGMRMDGAAVLACKTRMQSIAESGHVPVISAMGNLPILKDLVVDMEPFWNKFNAVNPHLQPGYEEPPGAFPQNRAGCTRPIVKVGMETCNHNGVSLIKEQSPSGAVRCTQSSAATSALGQ